MKILKLIIMLITLTTWLITISNAGWLEVPVSLDAKWKLEQYLRSISPSQSTNYTWNIEKVSQLFKDKKVYTAIKSDFLDTLLSNINVEMNSKYGVNYGFWNFQIKSVEDKKILTRLWILDAVKNFRYIPLDADSLKKLWILTGWTSAYNYFKDTLSPLIINSLGLNKLSKTLNSNSPTIDYVNWYPILLVPKNFDAIRLMWKYLFTNSDFRDNIIALEIPYNQQAILALIGLPNSPSILWNASILSSLALQHKTLQYLIKWKIKYPKELQPCFSWLDASTINDLSSLSTYMTNHCTNLLPKDLDCKWQAEYIWNFNEYTSNQYTVVYGLDEKNGLLYVVPVHRFFQKRLVALLPASNYDGDKSCWYNLMFQDKLSKDIDWLKSNTQWTHRLVWSSRDQWRPSWCSKWTDNNGIFTWSANSNNFSDACNVATLPKGFLNKWNDLVMNYGVYMTWDTNNMQLYYWLKDSKNNIQNMYEVGKYLWFDTNGSWLETKDLNIWFNNWVYNKWVFTPRYWQVNTNIYSDNGWNKYTTQNVEGKLIYNWKITWTGSSKLLDSIVSGGYFKKVFNNSNYGSNNLDRYSKIFIFGSGSTTGNNEIDLNYFDVWFNDYTTYYIYTLKTLADSTEKLELTQSLNMKWYNIFFKDIWLNKYDSGDNLDWEFVTFSWQNTFFKFNKYTWVAPKTSTSPKIDIDALRVEFGWDNIWRYKKITHLKLVYDKSQNMYVIKQADKWPLSQTFIQGIQLGGILWPFLKDCSLANYITDELKNCSHWALQPLNVDNDKENVWNWYIDRPEWVYTSGSELRIFNNIVKKDNFWNYTVQMKEILSSNNMQYCKKEAQTIHYYKNHGNTKHPLEVTENSKTYDWYSPNEDSGGNDNSGVSIVFKKWDDKFIYDLVDSWTNYFTKTYELKQVIDDSNNSIKCDN